MRDRARPFALQLLWTGPVLCGSIVLLHVLPARAVELDFYRDVYPFLKSNCISCHNKTTTKGDLDMETPESMKKGGETGQGIISGKGGESLIVQASRHTEDLEMPPKSNKAGAVNLLPAEIEILKTWIDQGAKSSTQQERQVVWQPLAPGVHPIYTVAMTKDGRFAACGRSNQLSVYDLATRQFVTQIVDETQKTGTAHRATVQSLAFSPDGARLASGSFREVKIWRQEKGGVSIRKGDATLGMISSVLNADGKQIIAADKTGALLVLDATNGKLIRRIADANKSGIKLLSVSPDASKAVTYGTDAILQVWSLADGKSIAINPPLNGIRALTWTGDGKSIATASEDKSVRLWSLPESGGTELAASKELKGITGAITTLLAGAAPDQLLTASEDGKVRLWSISEAKVLREIPSANVLCLGLSKDGKQLATGGADGAVRIWDLDTGKAISESRGSVATSQQMAALDWTMAAQGLEQAFQKSEVTRIEAQNKALDELLKKANETIVAVDKVLPEKQKAVQSAQEARAAAKKAVDEVAALITKAPDGKPDAALEKQQKDAQERLTAALMPETSALAAFSAAESNVKDAKAEVTRITDAKTKNNKDSATASATLAASQKTKEKAEATLAALKLALTKGTAKPLAVSFSMDAQKVAALFSDGTLNIMAVASGMPVEQIIETPTATASVIPRANGSFIACTASGATISTGAASRWVLERVMGGEKDHTLFADRVNAVCFSPDGKILAVGGGEPSRSGDISLFEVSTGKPIANWKERHHDVVLSLDFSPDGKLLASGGADKMARVTEIATGSQKNLFEAHTHYVMGVAFRADGRVLATAGADGVVNVWNMLMGERKKKIEGWTKEVTSLQFIGATNQIVTSAGDNLVRIFSDEGAEIRSIAKLPDFMQAAASTPNASTIIGGGEDSLLRVWDGTNGKELAVFGSK
ncbi:vegetatible incompatibility protein HET-E1 [soil metagenome]